MLSFPLDGREELPEGVPRQLGDAVLCPQVVGTEWRAPLVHGLLHLLGYEHGPEMEERERSYGGLGVSAPVRERPAAAGGGAAARRAVRRRR